MASGRRQYPFHLIEPKWQEQWEKSQSFRAFNPGEDIPTEHPFAKRHQLSGAVSADQLPPKYYVLDMFPYPSGAGLHVGHPEGYTATDILARYRRSKGFHVLHPMGWDAFGLPAEQYAVKTGQHPRVTTEQNIATFKRQINSLGFSYDWSREVNTTDPGYFKWSQWIFLQLYNSWFNPETNQAESIETLVYPEELQCDSSRSSRRKEAQVSTPDPRPEPPDADSPAPDPTDQSLLTSAATRTVDDLDARRRTYCDSKRLAFVTEAPVWWCEGLGTVLANEEVVDGKSEVGGHPVVRKPMRQWMLRITDYAERLLNDLDTIDWSHSLKEMQRNWIGRSEGAEVDFPIADGTEKIRVFTTRPDTLFGATYMVLSPEHPLVDKLTTSGKRDEVAKYREVVAKKSDLERTELAKEKTGVFTGAHAVNPVNNERIPIWIADYVLISYGTGAIMAVPAHDERDFEFAIKFGLPIRAVVKPTTEWFIQNGSHLMVDLEIDGNPLTWTFKELVEVASNRDKSFESRMLEEYSKRVAEFTTAFAGSSIAINSDFLSGLHTSDAKERITVWLEEKGLGRRTINYKLRDWLFSRQRYWGEPFPIVWKKDGQGNQFHEALPESALPVVPPPLEDYKPTATGEPPLARAADWVKLPDGSTRELNTMPQWAGSCWYYLRFLDSKNGREFVSKEAEEYWMGSRRGNEADSLPTNNPPPHLGGYVKPGVDLYVGGTEHAVLHLLYARFWHKVLYDLGHVSTAEPFYKLVNQGIILGEDGQKMSKSRGNVINPDVIIDEFGADAFRLYEMFMGPLEMMKPWNTKGVEGVYRFLGRVWRLFVDDESAREFEQSCTSNPDGAGEHLATVRLSAAIENVEATTAQLKTLHATIKKVTDDLEHLRFNTAISAMMVFVNEAMTWEKQPAKVLAEFLILLQPFAPHLSEELWGKLVANAKCGVGNAELALAYQPWPEHDESLLVEDELELPVQVNGKVRDRIRVPADATDDQIEKSALAVEKVLPFLEGKEIKMVKIVPKRLVNIVVK